MTKPIFDGSWARFPAGTLPCAVCGIAVPASVEDAEGLDVAMGSVRGSYIGNGEYREFHASKVYPVTRCGACRKLGAMAQDLLAAHVDFRRWLGSPVVARHQTESALLGLAVIGSDAAHAMNPQSAATSELARLVYALRIPGAAARWSTYVTSRRGEKVREAAPNPTRFAHVESAHRRALHEAWVELNLPKIMEPRPIVPLDDNGRATGCMLCGVGSWEALPGRAKDVWTSTSADAETLGGPVQPEPIDGVVCPRCDRAIDVAHGVGQSAMRASVLDYLGVDFGPRWEMTAPDFGLVGWCVLRERQPNAVPWDHIDLTPLHDKIVSSRRASHRGLSSQISAATG